MLSLNQSVIRIASSTTCYLLIHDDCSTGSTLLYSILLYYRIGISTEQLGRYLKAKILKFKTFRVNTR